MNTPMMMILTRALIGFYLAAGMFALGLHLGLRPPDTKEHKHTERRALVRTLVLELLILPLAAAAITVGLRTRGDVAIALLLVAASPGGRYAPHFVKLGGGDVSLAVEVTLFLAKLAVFTAPLTARHLLGVHELKVHELPLILQLLFLQLVPVMVGKRVGRHWPEWSKRVAGSLHVAVLGSIAALVVVYVLRFGGSALELLGDRGWLAVGLVGILSAGLGWYFGGHEEERRRAVAIGANAREGGLAMAMAAVAFPNHRTQLAVVGVWAAFLGMSVLTTVVVRSGVIRTVRRQPA